MSKWTSRLGKPSGERVGGGYNHGQDKKTLDKLLRDWDLYAEAVGLEGQLVINMRAAKMSDEEIVAEIGRLRTEKEGDSGSIATFYELTGRSRR